MGNTYDNLLKSYEHLYQFLDESKLYYNYFHELLEQFYLSDYYNNLTKENKNLFTYYQETYKDAIQLLLSEEEAKQRVIDIIRENGYSFNENEIEKVQYLNATFQKNKQFDFTCSELRNIFNVSMEDVYNNKKYKSISIHRFKKQYLIFPIYTNQITFSHQVFCFILKSLIKNPWFDDVDNYMKLLNLYIDYKTSADAYAVGSGLIRNYSNHLMSDITIIVEDKINNSTSLQLQVILKLYLVAHAYICASKGEAIYILDGQVDYNHTVSLMYQFYEDLNKGYSAFMSKEDYVLLYWIRFCIAAHNNKHAIAVPEAYKVLENREEVHRVIKSRKYPRNIFFINRKDTYLFRDMDSDYIDKIVQYLLNYYAKNFRFKDAYNILEKYDPYFSNFLKRIKALDRTTEEGENKFQFYLNYLEEDVKTDIALFIHDTYNYNDHTGELWRQRLTNAYEASLKNQSEIELRRYKGISLYISNVIVTLFANKHYEIVRALLNIHNEFLIQDEDYKGLKQYIEYSMESLTKNQVLEDIVDILQKEVSKLDFFVERVLEFDNESTADYQKHKMMLKQKLDKISSKYNIHIEAYMNCIDDSLKLYQESSNSNSSIFAESNINNIIDRLSKELRKDNEVLYATIEKDLIAFFKLNWNKFEHTSQQQMVTGNLIYNYLKNHPDKDKLDFSSACLSWCKAVEDELKTKIYNPLIDKYLSDINNPNYKLSSFSPALKKENYTLGSFPYVTGRFSRSGYLNNNVADWNKFFTFAKKYLYPNLSNHQLEALLLELITLVTNLNKTYRRKAAHPGERMNISHAEGCKDIIFETQMLLNKLVSDMDPDWCNMPVIL